MEPATRPNLKSLLEPVSRVVAELDAADPATCERRLAAAFPPGSEPIRRIHEAAREAIAAGTLCDRGPPNLRYSRVLKAEQDAFGNSVDAVLMEDSEGPAHTHTEGEFCLCLPESGEPTFEGRAATWIVMPKGSRHVPTVRGGRMLILYWLPQGAVVWG